MSKFTPLYKSDAKPDFSSYRPISFYRVFLKYWSKSSTANFQIILKNITFLKAANLGSIHEDLRN